MRTRTVALGALILAAVAVGGCTSAGGSAGARGTPATARGVPGFDTRDYPGDATMRRWFTASPYRWVGYYLPAPCYTGTTWTGRRAVLNDIGWGFAVLYVGEQDWRGVRPLAADTVRVAREDLRCSTANLTAERGREHAAEAEAAAAADGFPDGTIIYLDVERVERVSPELLAYVRAWTAALLGRGRFVPGLYAHDINVPELFTAVSEEFHRAGRTERPALWVARAAGFSTDAAAAESGYAVAAAWQGRFDVRETWDGVTLNIDVNVAASADPSRARR